MQSREDEKYGIYGPYYEKDRDRWRVNIDPRTSGQTFENCATQEEAEALVAELRKQRRGAERLEEVQEEYLTYLRHDRGNKPRSVSASKDALRRLLKGRYEDPAKILTKGLCQKVYTEWTTKIAADTHQNSLKEWQAFGRWLVKRRYLQENPCEGIEPMGKRSYGKKQLRVNEARAWTRVALRMWETEKREGALAALTTLLLGLRVSEVLDRKVRDLDDDGKLFWVGEEGENDTKNRSSRRRLEVPETLQPALLGVAEGKHPEDRLWSFTSQRTILKTVKIICERAKVPEVVTHSLRGLHATLAEAAGVSSHLVNSALGWTSDAIKDKSYTTPEARGLAKQSRALNILEGGKSGAKAGSS